MRGWLSPDPIGESGGLNLYGYVGNDPINFWDPLGLCPDDDYDSLDEAAMAAAKDILKKPDDHLREYGSTLYQKENGKFSYTDPVKGTKTSVKYDQAPSNTLAKGTVHNHPSTNSFSKKDINNSNSRQKLYDEEGRGQGATAYLTHKRGTLPRLHKYCPKEQQVKVYHESKRWDKYGNAAKHPKWGGNDGYWMR